jgi:hypothetical protein
MKAELRKKTKRLDSILKLVSKKINLNPIKKIDRLDEDAITIQRKINDHKRLLRRLESSYLIKVAEKDRADKILEMVVRI